MEPVRWDYRVAIFKNQQQERLREELTAYGRAGWELVALTTTVKTKVNVVGNDLFAVFKRPGIGPIDPSAEPDGIDPGSGWM